MIDLRNLDVSKRYVVGVSGGADSMCLLDLLKDEYNIIVAHVNHLIREDSYLDEDLVKNFCEKHNIPFHIRRLSNPPVCGIEDWGRKNRYSFFHQLLYECGADYILTAHNANDQAETVIMRIIRGCGLKGLRGIHEKSDKIIRPLLHITKEEIYDYCKTNNIPFREDYTNFDRKYFRNRVRHDILKKTPSEIKRLCNIADRADKAYRLILNKLKDEYKNKIKIIQNEIWLSKDINLDDMGFIFLSDLLSGWVDLNSNLYDKIRNKDSNCNVVYLNKFVLCDKRKKNYIRFINRGYVEKK